MLRLEAVAKNYLRRGAPIAALKPTNLEVEAGEYIALVGPSGSGKTTLLSILGGMLAPSQGRMCLQGKSLYELPIGARAAFRCQRIGFVFQTFNLIPYMTALENVQAPMYLAGAAPKEQRLRAAALLERLGLADRVHHKPSELSVGQQQRVALARTLANDPALILADEPTGNLDPATREQVLALFDEFHAEGRTLLMVTHDPAAAARAPRTLRLEAGELTEPARAASFKVA